MADNTAFRDVGSLPTYSDARFMEGNNLEAVMKCRSYDTFTLDKSICSFSVSPPASHSSARESADVILASVSPDRSTRITFLKHQQELWLEVQSNFSTAKREISSTHGQIYTDPSFGPLGGPQVSWNSTGTQFLYVAEKLVSDDEEDEYLSDFGDALSGKKRPAVFLVDLADLTPRLVISSEADGSVAYGQPVYASDESVIVTGYSTLDDGRRLGLIYCQNRLARLYHFNLDGTAKGVPLTPASLSARSARMGLGLLVYIANSQGGPHGSCVQIHVRDLSNAATLSGEVDDVWVQTVTTPPDSEFPGIYTGQLPSEPFLLLAGTPHIVVASEWRSRVVPLLISLRDKSVTNLAPCPTSGIVSPEELMSYNIFRTDGLTRVVGCRSLLSRAPELVVYDFEGEKQWVSVTSVPPAQSCMKDLAVSTIAIPGVLATEVIIVTASSSVKRTLMKLAAAADAQCVYAGASGDELDSADTSNIPPIVHIPHGGPHMHTSTAIWTHWTSYAIEGYTAALVNYTGSTGFGQDPIDALLGHVGDVDVISLHAVYEYLIKVGLASRERGSHFIEGLSHGGFLTAHMTSKYPDIYDGAILRNPVVDFAATFLHGSDIPEWTASEVGVFSGRARHAALPVCLSSAAEYEALAAASPIQLIAKVTTPSLLLLSGNDRRVQPSQGLAWYHGLRMAGRAATKCKMYKGEVHGLEGVEAEWKAWKASVAWYAGIRQA